MDRLGPASDERRRNRIVIGGASVVLVAIVGGGLLTDGGPDDEPASPPEQDVSPLPPRSADAGTADAGTACRRIAASAGTRYLGGADLDGDGDTDRIVGRPGAEEIWIEPARARGAGSPLVALPDAAGSVLDAVDLDGDGGDEVFVSLDDDEGGTGVIVGYDADACELRVVDTDAGAPLVVATGPGLTCSTPDVGVEVVVTADRSMDDGVEEVRFRVRGGSAEMVTSSDPDRSATGRTRSPAGAATGCSSSLAGEALAGTCHATSPIGIDDAIVMGDVDVDGDGAPDDVLRSRSRSLVWVRRADGTYSTAVATPTGLFRFHRGSDVDGDGDQEVVIEIGNGPRAWFQVHHAFDLDIETCALHSMIPGPD